MVFFLEEKTIQYKNKNSTNLIMITNFVKELLFSINKNGRSLNYNLILKNRSWLVIDEQNVINKFIFRDNNEIIISFSNEIQKGIWSFLPQDHSVLIELKDQIHLYSILLLEENLIFLWNQSNYNKLFLISNQYQLGSNHKSNLMSKLYTSLDVSTATLDSGEKLEIYGVFSSKDEHLIGRKVTINLQKIPDGVYFRNNKQIEFHIKNDTLVNIKKKN